MYTRAPLLRSPNLIFRGLKCERGERDDTNASQRRNTDIDFVFYAKFSFRSSRIYRALPPVYSYEIKKKKKEKKTIQ